MTLAPALRKGANTPVPTGVLRVVVGWAPGRTMDVCAVLVTELDRVRSDDDFVFYNAPTHPSGAVSLTTAAPGSAGLVATLPRVAPEVARIIVAGSLDDGTFPQLEDLTVTVTDGAGQAVTRFTPEPDEPVTALVFGEVYRRGAGWRFRAVGQGWDSGLAGLARGFGIHLHDPDDPGDPDDPDDPDDPGDPDDPDDPARRDDADRRGATDRRNDPERRGEAERHGSTGSGAAGSGGAGAGGDTPDTRVLPEIEPDEGRPAARASRGDRVALDADDERTLDEAAAARPAIRADWYGDPVQPGQMRWWDGQGWQGGPVPIHVESDTTCGRCGAQKRWRLFGGPPVCEVCTEEVRAFLRAWRERLASVLAADDGDPYAADPNEAGSGVAGPGVAGPGVAGPDGLDLEPLWAELRHQRIPASAGWEIVRSDGLVYLERLTAFAFLDGVVEAGEVARIEAVAERLGLAGPEVDALRGRLARGLELSRIGAGELPRLPDAGLHLELDEILHLDVPATLVRPAAGGPRQTAGRLLGTNRKLRFLGETGRGAELGLPKIVEVAVRGGAVEIAATTARGSGDYLVDDPEYVAAVLVGVLRVARRQVIAPGSRASRAIPQAVKAQVWRRDRGVCVECGGGEHLEFDHVIPFSRGGASSVNNLQLLCRGCNRAKGARI
ncbi:TerD family protein [Frankia sp. AgKG'84/4]|uniref:TerD family protein n=1 Tax=Frankia sp. AgKG'84/4 TaxID=573490 RepID=UPI002010A4F6|nr:TerD family protein [Frankia sp. AgKG'84/4]MCL9794533.1 TerD family protein [Frankia sp. AgKG'84/4]